MNVAIIGYGKMGRAIEALLNKSERDQVVLIIDEKNKADLSSENLRKADVAIEFTGPESAYLTIRTCLDAGIPIVSGSTGWLDKIDEIRDYCKQVNGSFFYAPNFSIGVNIFFELNRKLAVMMDKYPAYDIRMTETHHTEKKDAPSGTAIHLADIIVSQIDRKKRWSSGRSSTSDEVAITSKREENVPGTHIIQYESDVDSIELKHTAFSRAGFAQGAIIAAKWLIGKKGNFEMKNLINQ